MGSKKMQRIEDLVKTLEETMNSDLSDYHTTKTMREILNQLSSKDVQHYIDINNKEDILMRLIKLYNKKSEKSIAISDIQNIQKPFEQIITTLIKAGANPYQKVDGQSPFELLHDDSNLKGTVTALIEQLDIKKSEEESSLSVQFKIEHLKALRGGMKKDGYTALIAALEHLKNNINLMKGITTRYFISDTQQVGKNIDKEMIEDVIRYLQYIDHKTKLNLQNAKPITYKEYLHSLGIEEKSYASQNAILLLDTLALYAVQEEKRQTSQITTPSIDLSLDKHEKLQDQKSTPINHSIHAILDYDLENPEHSKVNFHDLVKQFDDHLSMIKNSKNHDNPTIKKDIEKARRKILDVYAQIFTAIASEEFGKIEINDLRQVKYFESKIKPLTLLSGNFATDVALQILNESNIDKRNIIIERYIELADKLTREGDFFSANAIFAGLKDPKCHALYKNNYGFFMLSDEACKKLSNLEKLYGGKIPERILLEEKMKSFNGPKLPSLDKLSNTIATSYIGSLDTKSMALERKKDEWKLLQGDVKKIDEANFVEIKRILKDLHLNRSKLVKDEKTLETIKVLEREINHLLSIRGMSLLNIEEKLTDPNNNKPYPVMTTYDPNYNAETDMIINNIINNFLQANPIKKEKLNDIITPLEVDILELKKLIAEEEEKNLQAAKNLYNQLYLKSDKVQPVNHDFNSIFDTHNIELLDYKKLNAVKETLDTANNMLNNKLSFVILNGKEATKEFIQNFSNQIKPVISELGKEGEILNNHLNAKLNEIDNIDFTKLDQKDRLKLYQDISNPIDNFVQDVIKRYNVKLKYVQSLSNQYLEQIRNNVQQKLTRKIPSFQKLLDYQEELKNRIKDEPDDEVVKLRLDELNKVISNLIDMHLNEKNVKIEEILDYLQISSGQDELTQHHSKSNVKGWKNPRTTAVKLLDNVYHDLIDCYKKESELLEAKMNSYEALQALNHYCHSLGSRDNKLDKNKYKSLTAILQQITAMTNVNQKITHLEKSPEMHKELTKHHWDLKGLLKTMTAEETQAITLINNYHNALIKEAKISNQKRNPPKPLPKFPPAKSARTTTAPDSPHLNDVSTSMFHVEEHHTRDEERERKLNLHQEGEEGEGEGEGEGRREPPHPHQ